VSRSERLVRLALERFEIRRTNLDEPFAIAKNGPRIALMFRGSRDALRASLARLYRQQEGTTPNSAALADALTALEGEALEASPTPVHLRVAEHDGGIVVDLGRKDGCGVTVGANGWIVRDVSPVIFRRTPLTGELPIPERGGHIDLLRDLVNVSKDTWPLVLGWTIGAFFPNIPHPILMLGGEQGAGKTTTARNLVALIDPSPAPLRSQPRDPEAWAISAAGSWLVAVDNVSAIPGWLSDALCKAATGDGWVRRKLYTDGDLAVVAYRRVVALTSIDAGALRGDLGDRLLLADLESIPADRRRGEVELERLLAARRAHIFGAILDIVSGVLAKLPDVRLPAYPRMADFAHVLAALDELQIGRFLEHYLEQRERIAAEVLEADGVSAAIEDLVKDSTWNGTARDLLQRITPEGTRPQEWPASPRALIARLRSLVPALRQIGVHVSIPVKRSSKGRILTIWRQAQGLPEGPSQPSQHSLPTGVGGGGLANHGDGSDGSDGSNGSDCLSPPLSHITVS